MSVFYKSQDSSEELAQLMKRELNKEAAEKTTNTDKLSEGISCLYKAASKLEELHELKAAEAITLILEKLSGEK